MDSPVEGKRLEIKTDASRVRRELEWIGVAPERDVLEIGCGTGAVTRAAALLAAPGSVVGVDASASRLEQARELAASEKLACSFIQAQATDLPFVAQFDVSFARMLFEYLDEPQQALQQLLQATRPGGTVSVIDLDDQISGWWPLPPHLEAGLREGLEILGRFGFDPFVGRKLFHWFVAAGLEDIEAHTETYQRYTGSLPESDLFNWQTKFATTSQRLAQITGDTKRWERLAEEMLAAIQRTDIFYHCTLVVVKGKVPEK